MANRGFDLDKFISEYVTRRKKEYVLAGYCAS